MKQDVESVKLGYYLHLAFTAFISELNRSLHDADIPLSHSQFSILQALSRSRTGVMSQRELATETGKDPAAISRTLQCLEKSGFIERTPISGCKNGVSLTKEALELKPNIEKVITIVTERAKCGFTEEEYAAGLSFLKKLHKILQKQ